MIHQLLDVTILPHVASLMSFSTPATTAPVAPPTRTASTIVIWKRFRRTAAIGLIERWRLALKALPLHRFACGRDASHAGAARAPAAARARAARRYACRCPRGARTDRRREGDRLPPAS